MKKIYEDDECIIIDTQNISKAFPIIAFYRDVEKRFTYTDGLNCNDIDSDIKQKIEYQIYKYCVSHNKYEQMLTDNKKFLNKLKCESNKTDRFLLMIEDIEKNVTELENNIKYAERFYNGK